MKRALVLLAIVYAFTSIYSQQITIIKGNNAVPGFTPYYILDDISIGLASIPIINSDVIKSIPMSAGKTYYLADIKSGRIPENMKNVIYYDFDLKIAVYASDNSFEKADDGFEVMRLSFSHPAIVKDRADVLYNTKYSGNIGLLDSLISGISSDSLYNTVAILSGELPYESGSYAHTRLMVRTWLDSAAVYLEDKLKTFGLDSVYMQPFSVNSYNVKNIVGYKKGSMPSNKCVVIGAHYDDYSSNFDIAPGADDNATGSAGVVEAARVLSGFDSEYDIYFVLFTGEEYGLYGSEYFVYDYLLPESIECIGMVNFDMIGYDPGGQNNVDMYGVSASAPLKNLFRDIADTLTPLNTVMLGSSSGSDHYYFETAGFKACFAIENNFSPVYHTTKDSIALLNFEYVKNVVRAGTATLVQIALMPQPAHITMLQDNGDSSITVKWQQPENIDIEQYNVYFKAQNDTFYNVYHAGAYDSTTISNLTPGVVYNVYVTAQDSLGFESFPGASDTITPSFYPNVLTINEVESFSNRIKLTYSESKAVDFQNYKIYRRKAGDASFSNIASVFDTVYYDSLIPDTSVYEYTVTAIDSDMYESSNSNTVFTRLIALSNGLLVIDETFNTSSLTDEMSDAFYHDVLGSYIYDIIDADSIENIDVVYFGNYSTILYIDDDLTGNKLNMKDYYSYIENGGAFIFSGWNIGKDLFENPASYPAVSALDSKERTVLNLETYNRNGAFDMDYFVYTDEDTSFNAYWDTTKLQRSSAGKLIYGGVFGSISGNNSVYGLYHSASGNADFNMLPSIVSADDSSFTLINLPIYYMHLKDAKYVVSYFLDRESILTGLIKREEAVKKAVSVRGLTNGNIYMLLSGFEGTEVKMEVIDRTGRVVKTEDIKVSGIKTNIKVNLNLSSGIYFVRLRSGDFDKIDKVSIIK